MPPPIIDFRLGDVLRLRKPHPCGGFEWQVVRLGADIGLECLTCHRRVLLERREVEKRTKKIVSRGPEIQDDGRQTTEAKGNLPQG